MIAHLALGSNLGDRPAHLRFAVDRLDLLPRTRVVACSRVFESDPAGGVATHPFLNAVVVLDTGLSATDLLGAIRGIEAEAGRIRRVRWEDRVLDLDVLFFGNEVFESEELTLPHPRLAERRFVLEPLAELAPDLRDPRDGRTVRELLAGCTDKISPRATGDSLGRAIV